ncbi:nucleotidyltransferase family protein [Haloplanus aerogenes]|uniref:Molybdenum cofactor cytidylyltransferase n=1 Tax=Haloplanus aerogenes TaxID=660522 RepID=A0A3M0CZ11_9EURY|nr:nucleotidyltransferase family protein [Haloplanus aerogenes]AZH25193.1 nucleotidyltransferase family protein [Haloplanus aerogenes]RMB13580.1 molybdenum cofactor cytidylyltransferase [Haloplanus aerogenes]
MTPDLPVVDPPDSVADPVREKRVAGVLLAAGTSSRFGERNKLLATLNGEPLVRHAARTLADAAVDPLVAVVGADGDRVAAALDGLGFSVVENPNHAEGQATSVRAGVRAVRDASDVAGAVFALGDMPLVASTSVDALVAAYRANEATALAAAYDGERGNPVLFDSRYFDALADVDGDAGGRDILLSGGDSVLVETGDPGVRRDVDTRTDLDRIRERGTRF